MTLIDKYYLAALCATPGIGRKKIRFLIERFGSAQAVFNAGETALRQSRCGCTEKQLQTFFSKRDFALPQKIASFCHDRQVDLVSIYDENYPKLLSAISDPPLVLYVRGVLPDGVYRIAVVGSRSATPYGLKAAAYFAQSLARDEVVIVSGGAKGIDAAAHEACLAGGGRTIAVLGCGIDIAYPAVNKELFEKISRSGAVITEFAPGTPPMAVNFPSRNRIIVGLSQGVLVAEAARKSGALITAHIAADEGREVYCVPGNIFQGSSIGCHDLARQGAKIVDTPQDVLEDLPEWNNLLSVEKNTGSDNKFQHMQEAEQQNIFNSGVQVSEDFPELARKILALLSQGAMSLEDLTEQSGAALPDISMQLLELQLAGRVATDDAQRYYIV